LPLLVLPLVLGASPGVFFSSELQEMTIRRVAVITPPPIEPTSLCKAIISRLPYGGTLL
jgi:hypothetical protein